MNGGQNNFYHFLESFELRQDDPNYSTYSNGIEMEAGQPIRYYCHQARRMAE